MVKVFKTNVRTRRQANAMLLILSGMFPGFGMNFDLSDCDKILRVEAVFINPAEITQVLIRYSYQCQILEE